MWILFLLSFSCAIGSATIGSTNSPRPSPWYCTQPVSQQTLQSTACTAAALLCKQREAQEIHSLVVSDEGFAIPGPCLHWGKPCLKRTPSSQDRRKHKSMLLRVTSYAKLLLTNNDYEVTALQKLWISHAIPQKRLCPTSINNSKTINSQGIVFVLIIMRPPSCYQVIRSLLSCTTWSKKLLKLMKPDYIDQSCRTSTRIEWKLISSDKKEGKICWSWFKVGLETFAVVKVWQNNTQSPP